MQPAENWGISVQDRICFISSFFLIRNLPPCSPETFLLVIRIYVLFVMIHLPFYQV